MRVKKIFILFLAIFIFILPACAKKEPEKWRQTPEVLFFADCGLDRLKCCATDPACTHGQQCCVDPNDSNRNYCADNCSCGESDEFCCAGNKCNNNGVCQNGICFACGGEKQPCCQLGQGCLAGLGCQDGKCAKCGVAGGPCCPGNDKCVIPIGGRAECFGQVCQNCGFDGNRPCQDGDKCLSGQFLAGKTCERCGGSNQPCCPENETSGYVCDPAKGLKCDLGFCAVEH